MRKAAILGAGYMGTAMAWPLSDNGFEIHLIGTHLDGEIIQSCKRKNFHPRLKRYLPKNVTPFFIEELETALMDTEFIVSGVNSMGVRWIGKKLSPYLKPGDRIISITKGLETDRDGKLVILPEVLRSELSEGILESVSITAVGGPCIAGELAGRRPSCVFFGCRDLLTAEYFSDIFRTNYYHIWTTADIASLEMAVALKNAYAAGVSTALGVLENAGGADKSGAYMHNLSAALFAQSGREMRTVLDMLGLDPSYAAGLPGVGDLYVTCQGGRSNLLGKWLGKGLSYEEAHQKLSGVTLEAAYVIQQFARAIPRLESSFGLTRSQLPLMYSLVDVIAKGKSLEIPLEEFFFS